MENHAPSREFMVRQAVLNAVMLELGYPPKSSGSYLQSRWNWDRVDSHKYIEGWCRLIPIIRSEFRKIASQYGDAE